jgi:hypothetical protein
MGDAVRAWIVVLASMGVIFFFPLDLESGVGWTMFYLAFYDVLCVVWLGLIWLSLYESSPEATRRWALAQNRDGSLRQRVMRTFYGTRVFGGKTGLFTIATVVSIGLFSALTLVPDLGRTATVMSVVGVVAAGACCTPRLLSTTPTFLTATRRLPTGFASRVGRSRTRWISPTMPSGSAPPSRPPR